MSVFEPAWTTVPEVCNLHYTLTMIPVPENPTLIVFQEDMETFRVTVEADSIYYNGNYATGTYNPGSYDVEVRAWADNNFDTGMAELLTIHIIDPCLEGIIKPESPLPLLTYYIGSVETGYDVQAISDPLFHSPTPQCGGVGFFADHYY